MHKKTLFLVNDFKLLNVKMTKLNNLENILYKEGDGNIENRFISVAYISNKIKIRLLIC